MADEAQESQAQQSNKPQRGKPANPTHGQENEKIEKDKEIEKKEKVMEVIRSAERATMRKRWATEDPENNRDEQKEKIEQTLQRPAFQHPPAKRNDRRKDY